MKFLRLILLLSLFFIPLSLAAEPGTEASIDAIAKGNEAYEAGDFYKAIREYRTAFRLTKDPRLSYRIGISYETLGNFQRAREYLEDYLRHTADTKFIDRVKKKLSTLKKLEDTVQSTAILSSNPHAAEVFLRSETHEPLGTTPINVPLAPGSHTFIFVKDGYQTGTLTLQIDSSQNIKEKLKLVKINEGPAKKKKEIKKKIPIVEEPDPSPLVATQPTMLRSIKLGPSKGTNVLLWGAIAISMVTVLVSGVGFADESLQIPSLPLALAGGGVFSLSGYFLWFHNWDSNLALASGRDLRPMRSFSIGFKF